jgi:hypothetical protein
LLPQSPDFRPCDFLLLRWAKQKVCRSKPRIFYGKEQQIQDKYAAVTLDYLGKFWA